MDRNARGSVAALAILSIICLSSCGSDRRQGRIRAEFAHSFGYALDVGVALEGSDGRSLDAASVILRCPDSSVLLLDYDSDSCRYEGSISYPPSGTYRMTASSLGLDGDLALEIPFTALTSKPTIRDIQDSGGSSAISGDSLSADMPIAMSAAPVAGADRYRLSVYSGGGAAFSASSLQPTIVVPPTSLQPGSYSACVEARTISGDPLLKKEDFYSASASSSSLFAFNVASP